ncbi:hypothetical protein B0H16DRAFT_1690418 [Mycena metata]|uniref:Secreted protein n=1 Tax=Mycena metata TaxID=1033252 RepID=A0AAD7J5C5_9AGAR|nr:hypothetical protein B0H16DRAFT_1690418 [Mycena metata]
MAGPFVTLAIYCTLVCFLVSSSHGRSVPLQARQKNKGPSEGTDNRIDLRGTTTKASCVSNGTPATIGPTGKKEQEVPGGAFSYYKYTEGDATIAKSPLTQATTQAKVVRNDEGVKCDHILELNVLKNVMENGGPCTQLAELYGSGDTTKQADATRRWTALSTIINNHSNLMFVDRAWRTRKLSSFATCPIIRST